MRIEDSERPINLIEPQNDIRLEKYQANQFDFIAIDLHMSPTIIRFYFKASSGLFLSKFVAS